MSAIATTVEVVLAAVAWSQHGLVTRTQLLAAGLTRHQIQHRVDRGALLCVHRGVYRVGHRAPSVEAHYLAAVLACGDEALLSGRAAAHLLGLLKGRAPRPEVTTPLKRRVPGVAVRRGRTERQDRAIHRGILEILRENGLPLPRTNRPAGTYRVDCRWPERRLTVELDSYRFHSSRHAWEQDRRREREARARGDELYRYTWGDVFEEPAQMLAELHALLA